MTLPNAAPGYSMNRPKRPAVNCAVCTRPIDRPYPLQKVHAGKCHREWNRLNAAKFHAKKKLANARKAERRLVGAIKAVRPVRCKAYREFVREFHCIICTHGQIVVTEMIFSEAAHTGPHGISQKSSDFSCIPLCAEHHTEGRDSYHKLGEKRFEAHHGLRIADITKELRTCYTEGRAAA